MPYELLLVSVFYFSCSKEFIKYIRVIWSNVPCVLTIHLITALLLLIIFISLSWNFFLVKTPNWIFEMFFLILLTLLCIIVVLLIKYILHKRRLSKYVRDLPTVKGYPFVGCGYQFLGKNAKGTKNSFFGLVEIYDSVTFSQYRWYLERKPVRVLPNDWEDIYRNICFVKFWFVWINNLGVFILSSGNLNFIEK